MAKFTCIDIASNSIEYLAESVLNSQTVKNDLSKVLCIFSNRRASLYLLKNLAEKLNSSYFPPKVLIDDDFVREILLKHDFFSDIPIQEYYYLIYKISKKIAPGLLKDKTFPEFLPWAKEVTNLIEQMDLEDVDNDSLKNLSQNAQIGFDIPPEISRLLQDIFHLREEIHKNMEKTKRYSRGYQYLKASRLFDEKDVEDYEKIYIFNFFYIQKTEKNIFSKLAKMDKVEFIFQGDERDWKILKDNANFFGVELKTSKLLSENNFPEIKIYKSSDFESQAIIVQNLIKKMQQIGLNTSIVLLNNDSLLPTISTISPYVENFNLSLKYPLNRASFYELISLILNAQISKKGNGIYYAADYLKVILHPLAKNWEQFYDRRSSRILVHSIEDILLGRNVNAKDSLSGRIFIALNSIEQNSFFDHDEQKHIKNFHKTLFTSWESIKTIGQLFEKILELANVIVKFSILKSHPINYALCNSFYQKCQELKSSPFADEEYSFEEMQMVFEEIMAEESIGFLGTPLNGLQILGLFQSHSINFDNVFVLDANEGFLPKALSSTSLLPKEIQFIAGIQRARYFEEIQKYQFFRLIFSSKKSHIIYVDDERAEKSRFLEQLMLINERSSSQKNINQIIFTNQILPLPAKQKIKKSKEHIKYLENREFSPTLINTYLSCPAKFYYQYILGLKENEQLLVDIEANEIGIFFHELLHDQYKTFLDKKPIIDEKFLEKLLESAKNKFKREFSSRIGEGDFLLFKSIKFAIERFIEIEKNFNIRKLIRLEKEYDKNFNVNGRTIKMKGIIDRIDLLEDGTYRLIDYKTGGLQQIPSKDDKKLSTLTDRTDIKKYVRSFQLPIYIFLMSDNFKFGQIEPMLIYLKESRVEKLWKDEMSLSEKKSLFDIYLASLGKIIEEILNPNVDFETDDEDVRLCEMCPYNKICR